MTTTGIQVDGPTKGQAGRPVLRTLSLSVAKGEIFGVVGANGARKSTAVEKTLAFQRQGGGRTHVRGLIPAEHQGQVRHLVIFPARVL